jgi:tRNA(His) guanylyltransferase
MKFNQLDTKMRIFETAHDHCVLPGLFMVARLDGRNFTKLTKQTQQFEAPFDARFRDLMLATVEHLMTACGIQFRFGYTESDEISLLFEPNEDSFGRKLRKLVSVLAGEASAALTLRLGVHACFDCRISQIPSRDLVVDYFRWRNEDAHRNALNAHCYWSLRKQGLDARAATAKLVGLSNAQKNELLFQNGINFNDTPAWQRRGCALYWQAIAKPANHPLTGAAIVAQRQRLHQDLDLPMREAYSEFLRDLIADRGNVS